MQRSSVVLDVEIVEGGATHTASYFVEHGVIHANIAGRILVFPANGGDAAAMVISLLKGRALQTARMGQNASRWRAASIAATASVSQD